MSKTIIGVFDKHAEAREAIQALRRENFPSADISVIVHDPTGEYASELNLEPGHGAVKGAGKGAVLGGLGGLLLGLGVMAVPGLGPVLTAGPLAGILTGAGFGAVAGGILGAFNEMGIPEQQAHYYAEAVRRGATVVAVKTAEEDADRVLAIMDRHGAVDVNRRVAEWREHGWTEFNPKAESTATTSRTGETDFPKSA